MLHVQSPLALALLSELSKTIEEEALRLAQASLNHGSKNETEWLAALECAQRSGVTNAEFMRSRLLVGAGIAASAPVERETTTIR